MTIYVDDGTLNIKGNFGYSGNVYTTNISMGSPYVNHNVTVARVSDLHLCRGKNGEIVGEKNTLLVADAINDQGADVILIPGDIINDSKDLEDKDFCYKLVETIKKMAGGRLVIIELGNHDIASYDRKTRKWSQTDSKLLKDVFEKVDNVVFLEDVERFCLAESAQEFGFKGANINIVGGGLQWPFYFKDKENSIAFRDHCQTRFGAGECFIDDSFNILAMHAIGKFIELYRELGFATKVDLCVGGHQHNGMFSNKNADKWPGYYTTGRAPISPPMGIFQKYQRGIIETENTLNVIGGPTNIRVDEIPALNDLFGPKVDFIHICRSRIKEEARIKHGMLKVSKNNKKHLQ